MKNLSKIIDNFATPSTSHSIYVNPERPELCDRSSTSLVGNLTPLCEGAVLHMPTLLLLAFDFAQTKRRGGRVGWRTFRKERETIARKMFSSILFLPDILLGKYFPASVFFWIAKKGMLFPKEAITCFVSLVL